MGQLQPSLTYPTLARSTSETGHLSVACASLLRAEAASSRAAHQIKNRLTAASLFSPVDRGLGDRQGWLHLSTMGHESVRFGVEP